MACDIAASHAAGRDGPSITAIIGVVIYNSPPDTNTFAFTSNTDIFATNAILRGLSLMCKISNYFANVP